MALQSLDQGARPEQDATTPSAVPVTGLLTTPPVTVTIVRERIQYGGRIFYCTPEMARIFLKHARDVIESGEEQLVPLLHSGGIDLLLVSRATPYTLLDPPET
ncbi:hypothetical protein GCM10022239_15740 [Leifsonia bigeumensis]|uniref:Uncharacterized protein n=1 Tax=Leifsonella bigeumensis TaxID=433643 RepID=A0ABP7FKH6_9MICO